jgi:RNA polymerase-binding transcription factor DksA
MDTEKLRGFRKLVENEIRIILRDESSEEVKPNVPVRYCLDFKGNARLSELQYALERMEQGMYGRCVLFGGFIEEHVLQNFLTARLCSACEGLVLKAASKRKVLLQGV